jgi:hypothetical protein
MARDTFLDDDDTDEQESGSGLRKKLEAAIASNKKLTEQLSTLRVKDLIVEKGLKYVKPEELAGVALDEIEKRATDLEASRRVERASIAREVFVSQGLEGDDLEAAVADLVSGSSKEKSAEDEALERTSAARKVTGTPAPLVDTSGLTGQARLEAVFSKQIAKRKS